MYGHLQRTVDGKGQGTLYVDRGGYDTSGQHLPNSGGFLLFAIIAIAVVHYAVTRRKRR